MALQESPLFYNHLLDIVLTAKNEAAAIAS